jgi:hypothetical protein
MARPPKPNSLREEHATRHPPGQFRLVILWQFRYTHFSCVVLAPPERVCLE